LARKVLVTDYAWPSLDAERRILATIDADLVVARSGDEDELSELARDVDAIMTNWKPVTAPVLRAAQRCVTVARYGVGVDNIDVETATALGMLVSNVPDYCVEEVSDHTIALVLALIRRLVDFANQTRAGGWDNQSFGALHRVRGQTLGLVGFGRIGRLVAAKAQALGFAVLAFTPRLEPGDHDGVEAVGSLDSLLERSDVVSLHAPLTPETRHLLGRDELARMRPRAFIVNTARGGLLDIDAVRDALEEGRLGGAGLDVLDEEPPPHDDPIRRAPRVLLTPHAAFYSAESIAELEERAAVNVVTALSGGVPPTLVNPKVLDSPSRRGHPRIEP
jgi:D-3-phosphoglycerate dehydrogenase / 2-oxoglutarate reductase